jgi:hypothetical protein
VCDEARRKSNREAVDRYQAKNADLVRERNRLRMQRYRRERAAEARAYDQEYRATAKAKDTRAAYRDRTRSIARANSLAWQKANMAKVAASSARRRANRLQATPRWLSADDLWMIGEMYDLASRRTASTGFAWHVDHIIPLQGKQVRGLHVPWNLQVIPAVLNRRKQNRVELE